MFDAIKPYAEIIRLVLILVGFAVAMFGFVSATQYFEDVGYQRAVNEYESKLANAKRESIQKERELQNKVNDANERSSQREKQHKVELALLDSRTVRMRDEIFNFRNLLSKSSGSAAIEAGNSVSELFGECVEQYQSVARAADGHAEDAVTLREAWPK